MHTSANGHGTQMQVLEVEVVAARGGAAGGSRVGLVVGVAAVRVCSLKRPLLKVATIVSLQIPFVINQMVRQARVVVVIVGRDVMI